MDIKEKILCYGDSLIWDTPSNLIHMVEQLLSKLGIQYKFMHMQLKDQSTYILLSYLNLF